MCRVLLVVHIVLQKYSSSMQRLYYLLRKDHSINDVDESIAAFDVFGDHLGIVDGQLIHQVSLSL